MKTYSAKPADVTRAWYVLDASEAPLGRLATQVASLLMGKGKPMFTSHIDCGDYVIITNAAQLVVTGNKRQDKKYYRHSGHPGNLHTMSLEEKLAANPADVIMKAVRGMLPDNKLRQGRLDRLKIYAEETHHHEAQKPVRLTVKEGK